MKSTSTFLEWQLKKGFLDFKNQGSKSKTPFWVILLLVFLSSMQNLQAQSKMYWINNGGGNVTQANIDGTSATVVASGLSSPDGACVANGIGKLFWVQGGTDSLYRSNLNGSGKTALRKIGIAVRGITIDENNGKLYIIGASGYAICDLDGVILFLSTSGYITGRQIAIDPINSKIYFTNQSSSLFMANADSSNKQTLFSNLATAFGVRVNPTAGLVYFSDNQGVYSCDLTGTGRTTLVPITTGGQFVPIGIDPRNNKLFWALNGTIPRRVRSSTLTGTDTATIVSTGVNFAFDIANTGGSSLQAFNINYTNITGTTVSARWNKGNGTSRAAFIKADSIGTPNPLNGTGYTANAAFGSGAQIGTSGWYCVYNGTDSVVNITGLTAGTKYRMMVCEYAGSGSTADYNVAYATLNPLNFTTVGASNSLATLVTSSISTITSSSATLGGNITNDGGASVTERGIVYALTANPTTANTKVQIGTGVGTFSQNITGLTPSTTYYVRAYAINSVGTAYGSDSTFTTLAAPPTIISFIPASAPVGSLVTIIGTNLNNPTAITIGGVAAIPISNTGSSLVTMLMPGAITGAVSVTTLAGTASATGNFTVTIRQAPNKQQGNKLVGTDTIGNAQQGRSTSISADGNTAIVGGWNDNSNAGATWVYTRTGSTWSQQGNKLVGTGAIGNARQGTTVSLSADGNTAIVGAVNDSLSKGAAWVFIRNGSTWSQQGNKLVGSGSLGSTIQQGVSVSLSADGNTAIVGGNIDNGFKGAAWIYSRSGGVWSQQGNKLVGTGATGNARQGTSVSISADGKTAIVGGSSDNGLKGAVWVYTLNGGIWSQQGNKLVGTDTVGNSQLGHSVSISADGNTAIVGGRADNGQVGATWVFTRSGGVWSQQGSKLVGTGAVGSANQGTSVGISADGNTAIVGGQSDNSNAGASWVFTRNGNTWNQLSNKLNGSDTVGAAGQGVSVSISADGNTALVGGFNDKSNAGAAWVYYEVTNNIPSVSTSSILTITTTSATMGGNATADGGASITERGVVYATTANPTTANTKVQIGSGIGNFSQNVTGLIAGTLYHVRAYAINSVGTSYGADSTFTTTIISAPLISLTGTLTVFTACETTISNEQSFSVSGLNLTANITVTAPTGFEISTTAGAGFTSSINLVQTGGIVAASTIYIRMSNTAAGSPTGNVTATSTGATSQNIAASGTVTPSPAKPIISLTPPTPICVGTTYLNFGASGVPEVGVTFKWSTSTSASLYAQGSTKQYALISFPNAGAAKVILTATQNGCSAATEVNLNIQGDTAHQATVRYFNSNFICQANLVQKYQWGYDDIPTLRGNIIDTNAINQNYFNPTPEFSTKSYWVISTKGTCYQKTYYNTPSGIISSAKETNKLSVYPNPFNSQITLSSEKGLIGTKLDLIDLNGKKLATYYANTNEFNMSLDDLAAGVYFINASSELGYVSSLKIVKY